MTVLAVTGLRREARILASPGVTVLPGGGDAARLATLLEQAAADVSGIISIGIAGALAPGLHPGEWVVADAIHDDGGAVLATDAGWSARLLAKLPGARFGPMLGRDGMVAEAAEKGALHRRTAALTVDMESHLAARVAARKGLAFAAARVVSDGAARSLPPAARVGMRPDGGMDLRAVLRALCARPGQLPALVRTGWEAERAFRALFRGQRFLGAGLAGPCLAPADLGQLPRNMA